MKLLAIFATALLVGLVSSAPASDTAGDDEVIEINKQFFLDELVVYTAEHDIVNLLVPLNALNFEDDTDDEEGSDELGVLFFVLADNENGKRIDQGLFVRRKGVVTKLLDNGRDAAAANDDTKIVYFAAQDGLYYYNSKENKAEKYGTLTDSIIDIVKVNGTDIIYILTDDRVVYKVTEEGTKKERIENIVNAEKIVLDYENNLYFLTSDKKLYVVVANEVKQVDGLPEASDYVDVFNPPFILDNGIPVLSGNQIYVAYPNATSQTADIRFQVKPSAYSVEATLIQYYGYEKKIYEYNILTILASVLTSELKTFLEAKADTISELATRSRSDLVI